MRSKKENITTPLLSICCITYNHAPFIRQCLDGFVMQKTNFPVEVLIHDDASTDGTADIIREYEKNYPKLIKPIYQTENQYSKGISISRTFNFPRIKGKYIAICEGDDYWTDEYKLQKQVDFMEANEDFSICFHPVKVYSEEEKQFIENNTVPEVPDVTDIKKLALVNYINTLSVVYRYNKQVFDDLNNFPKLPVGDYLLHMLFAKYGKIKKLSDTMAVYRLHKGGTWSSKPIEYTYPIWLKLLTGLIYHFIEDREIRSILVEQYRRLDTPEHPDFISKNATIYFNTGNGYSENEKYNISITGNELDVKCQIPENIITIRFDPIENHGCILSNLEILSYNGIVKYEPINGYKNDNGDMVFVNTDPQIELKGAANWVKIKYHILPISDSLYYKVFENYIETSRQRDELLTEKNILTAERNALTAERNGIINSWSWRLTKPLRLFKKGIKFIKRNGIAATVKKTNHYWKKTTFKKRTTRKYDTSSLISFAKTVKMFGGTIFGKKILDKWSADNSAKKILLISHELNLTGAPIALHYFAENLKKNGYYPIIISPNDGSLRALLLKEGFPVIIYYNLYASDLISQYASLFELLIVNTIVGAPIISALNSKKIPVLWWIHEANVSYHQAALAEMPEHLKNNIHVYCAGPYAVKLLKKYRPNYQINELQLYIPDHMKSLPRKNLLKIKSDKEKCIFVLVGMQEERKGQDILIQAIRMLSLEQLKRCLFIFVGRRYHLPIMKSISQIINEYPKNIQFIEELDRKSILSLYQQMDCFICPSRDDTGPIVVYDAMVMSKLIICSENTGAANFLEQMNAGLIYHNNSPEELSKKIQFVLENRFNLSQMREQARKTYELYFSQDIFKDSVEKILQKLIREKDSPYNGTVSIIIPTYNAGEELRFLIELLKSQTGIGKVEIIIVDSGSSDGTAELAEKMGAVVLRIAQSEFTHSFSRNLGAKNATGEYLLFMTQDALPTGNTWIHSLMKPIIQDNVVAVSCRETPKPECDLLGRISNWIHNEYMGILQSDRIMQLPEQNNYESIRKNAQLNDVANLIRKDIFTQFWYQGNYAEDLDLGIRLIQAGYQLSLLSSVQVIHSHTRPAVYHLKRSIVDNLALKKIMPDYPMQKIDAQTAVNRIITAYCITIYMARYLAETCETNESESGFFKRIEKYYSHVLSIVQNMTFDKLKELAKEDTKVFDSGIKAFIQKLLTDYNIAAYDPAISVDQFNYIINIIPNYLNTGKDVFSVKFKEEIGDLMVKLYGIISGCHLAFYYNEYYYEKNILNKIIGEYTKGI